jgi:FAD/FMN-containing dehydrogenase
MTETLSPVLGEATIEELRQAIRGPIVTPEDEGYDEARAVWNGLHDERPALVAQPTGAADVAAAVGFARSHDLPIAVRGGGHSIAGSRPATTGS